MRSITFRRVFGVAAFLAPLLLLSACGSEAESSNSEAPPVLTPPTVSMTASPMSVNAGGSSMLSWTSDAANCQASGGWSGMKAANGSGTTGTLNADTLFSLTCTAVNGTTAYAAVTIDVNASTPAPTATISANPASVTSGASSTLTWSSTNATSCTASGGWTGAKATSGTQSTGALTANRTYTLTCSGTGTPAVANTTVTVSAAGNARPTANAGPDQTVASAASVSLNGTGTDTDGTIASYMWTQTMGTAVTLSNAAIRNPTFTAPTVTTDTTLRFSLVVTDNGGSASTADTVNVVVQGPQAPPTPSQPLGFYTDVASAPVGARVTAYGTGFGASGTVTLNGTTQTQVSYSDTKVVFTVSGSGGALMVGGRSLGNLPVHTGRLLEATPSTLNQSFWAGVQPGDFITLRAGTYTQTFGEGTWYFGMGETYKKGTASQPIAVVAYPGETVTMQPSSRAALIFGNGSDTPKQYAEWLTFAGFNIIGSAACISGAGDSTNPAGGPDETGGRNIRIVAMDCRITDASSNTMTGLIDLGNDGWKLLGNVFHDPANRVVINNNHTVYIQGGADDVEVAYNTFVGLHTGHVVQIHQDGTPKLYERVNVHDNVFRGTNYGDMRGISVINVDNASTVTLERNSFRHQGQGGWGCINIYRGQVTVNDNDCRDSEGGINVNGQYGGSRRVTGSGNASCPIPGYPAIAIENGAVSADITLTGLLSCL